MLLKDNSHDCVGLIPAAGKAERVAPLPCSKEIYPVGFGEVGKKGGHRPKVAAHYLLEKMRLAGAEKAYVVLSKGKWDIPAYFGDGAMARLSIAYLMTDLPYGVPFTLDSAFPFLGNKRILFGFPDIIFKPDDVYVRLLNRMQASAADIVLGLFPAVNPSKMDMVELAADGTIGGIFVKPDQTELTWTWIVSVWNDSFTRFMHGHVQCCLNALSTGGEPFNGVSGREIHLGEVFQAAIESELTIDKVIFNHGTYVDIGTPDDMVRAAREHMRFK